MSTNTSTNPKKENQYNIDSAKQNASTGTLIGSQADLQKYGIDYSQEQRDQIANIFANQATAAYGTAQQDYAKTMAAEQNSLRDTIRRSQAQSVATGASRGMQAANELSAMLGLQEQAAQGAAQMQGSYAEALANAQQQAMEIQNARAQVGSNIAAADIAGEAQKYSVGMDYQANDPLKVLDVIKYLEDNGDSATANMLRTVFMTQQGATESQVAGTLGNITTQNSGNLSEAWSKQGNTSNLRDTLVGDNFDVTIDGVEYGLELGTLQSSDSEVTTLANQKQVPLYTAFIYKNQVYIRTSDGIHRVGGTGKDGVDHTRGDYSQAYNAISKAGLILE